MQKPIYPEIAQQQMRADFINNYCDEYGRNTFTVCYTRQEAIYFLYQSGYLVDYKGNEIPRNKWDQLSNRYIQEQLSLI